MGNASSHTYASAAPPPTADARVILQHDLPKAIYVKKLANGKFIKSYQCRVDGVMIVVKAYIKRDPQEDLGPVEECLTKMAKVLDTRSCPNVLPYQRWLQSNVRASQHRGAGTPAYLMRQHLLGTLSDRLSTRPFLTDTEKRWLVYLLLRAVAQCHAKGVCHGDIKSENVLVTSGNWLLLTDFAPFKPTFLPDDHPADANYYFSSGEQGRCYLAPERFHSAPQTNEDSGSVGGGGGTAATTVTSGAGTSDGGVPDVAGGYSSGAGSRRGGGGGLEGLEASEIGPSPGLDIEASTPASDSSSSPMGLDTQAMSSRQQQQQQPKQGGGRDDGSRSMRGGGPGSIATAERQVLTPGEGLLESMDVFSLGCVIAEIFLGGDPLLDLPGLLRYRISGDMDSRLKKLETAGGPVVLRLVEHMVQRDASQRKTVQEYIRRMEKPGMLFPRSFGSFLFPLLATMHAGQGAGDGNSGEKESPVVVGGKTKSAGEAIAKPLDNGGDANWGAVRSPDGRLELVVRSYGRAMRDLAGTPDPEGHALLQAALLGGRGDRRRQPTSDGDMKGARWEPQGVGSGAAPEVDKQQRRGGTTTDRKGENGDLMALMERTRTLIARVEALGVGARCPSNEATPSSTAAAAAPDRSGGVPENASIASDGSKAVVSGSQQGRVVGGGDRGSLIILVQVVCSCLRHLRYPRSRLLALNLLVAFGRCCDDEARLQRLVPYTMTMLEDPVPMVRATAMRSLRALLGMVTFFPPSDSNIFLLYIFPALQRLPSDSSDLVRIAFAESLASLAETSRRFLETAYAMRRVAAASAAAASAIANAGTAAGGSGGAGQGSSLTSANQQDVSSAVSASVPDVENKKDYDGGEDEDTDGRRSEGGVMRSGSGGISGGGVNNKRNSAETGAGAVGAVLLDGNYDKELSSIRGQISRWFVVLASSGGSGGGSGGNSNGVSGDWSGIGLAAIAAAAAGADDGVGAGAAAVMVKRALLSDITRLCVFFGFENTLDSILPQLITFLNDRDWSLRAAFCEHIPAVCALAGEVATTRFILPCIENTLVDAREAVVARGLRCLAALAGLGLLPKHALPGQAMPAAPLLQHPGIGIRAGAMELCLRAAAALGPVDAQVFLHPVLRPHLRYALSGSGPLGEAVLFEALRPPVSRQVFDAAVAEVCEARRLSRGGDKPRSINSSSSAAAAAGASMITQKDVQQSMQSAGEDSGMHRQATVSADSTRGENQEPPLELRQGLSGAETVASFDKGFAGVGRRVSSTASSEEQEALSLLKGCINNTVQHVANKGRGGGGKGSVSRVGGRSSPVFLPESLSQAIYVPTQKITTLHPGVGAAKTAVAAAVAAADGRREEIIEFDGAGEDVDIRLHSPVLSSSPSLLQAVTGMHVNAFDARRAMALVEQADADGWPDGYTPSGTYSSPVFVGGQQGRGGAVSPGWEKSVDRGRADELAALLRRAKALGVPPLPPDLGAVRGPNGAKYSHYLLQPSNGISSSTASSNVASSPGSSSTSSAAAAAAAAVQHHQQQQQHNQPSYEHGSRRPDWRPRQGVLVACLAEHGGSVNRLALSQDQSFFVSASSDGTCKVWELRGMEHTVNPQSRATYSRQGGKLLDLCIVDNSHSVASASSDGTVHVWRVELAASTGALHFNSSSSGINSVTGGPSNQMGMTSSSPHKHQFAGGGGLGAHYANGAIPVITGSRRRYNTSIGNRDSNGVLSSSSSGGGGGRSVGNTPPRVCGSSMVRCVSPEEGPLVSVHHFNTELGSPLVYGTRKGGVRSWDLRAREEPWALRAHPELGFLTAIALGTEKTWLVVGTSRGFVMLWDLRFQILARLWRHSSGGPVHKLATCSRLPPPDTSPGPHVILAAGRNEAAIWDLSRGGACKQCFRVIPPSERPSPSTRGRSQSSTVIPGPDLPVLEEVPLPNHPNTPALSLGAQLSAVRDVSSGAPHGGGYPVIRALVGRISRSERDSYLITGGTDRCIRYWDFQAASRCYMVSGREPFLGRPASRTLQVPGVAQGSSASNVVVYYDDDAPAPTPTLVSKRGLLPLAEEKGLVAPRSSHEDAVLDVKVTELPIKMLLSAGRDGVVKIWR